MKCIPRQLNATYRFRTRTPATFCEAFRIAKQEVQEELIPHEETTNELKTQQNYAPRALAASRTSSDLR